jgi:heme/copper-type cytochrome/quinol oxidase subunit 3
MSGDPLRWDRRRPEGVEERPLGWWGTLLLAAVLATTYAALCFAYVYVRVASTDWPPQGIDPPALGLAGLAALALAASAPAVGWAARRETAHAVQGYRLGLVVAVGLAAAHFGLLLADWAGQPFTVGGHAYGSLYFVLPGIHFVILGLGVVFAVVLLALSWHPEGAATGHVGILSLRIYWYVTVLGGVLLLGVVYLLPHVWREAIAP